MVFERHNEGIFGGHKGCVPNSKDHILKKGEQEKLDRTIEEPEIGSSPSVLLKGKRTLNRMSEHMAFPCVIMGSWSSPLPSQQSNSIHLKRKGGKARG